MTEYVKGLETKLSSISNDLKKHIEDNKEYEEKFGNRLLNIETKLWFMAGSISLLLFLSKFLDVSIQVSGG